MSNLASVIKDAIQIGVESCINDYYFSLKKIQYNA